MTEQGILILSAAGAMTCQHLGQPCRQVARIISAFMELPNINTYAASTTMHYIQMHDIRNIVDIPSILSVPSQQLSKKGGLRLNLLNTFIQDAPSNRRRGPQTVTSWRSQQVSHHHPAKRSQEDSYSGVLGSCALSFSASCLISTRGHRGDTQRLDSGEGELLGGADIKGFRPAGPRRRLLPWFSYSRNSACMFCGFCRPSHQVTAP